MTRRIVEKEIDPAHYTADGCIVWCIDDRFKPLLEAFKKKADYRRVDEVTVAGGAKSLVNTTDGDAWNSIQASVNLHNAEEIVLMVHEDCGAYNGAHLSLGKKESEFLVDELEAAREAVRRKFPNVPVRALIADFKGIKEI